MGKPIYDEYLIHLLCSLSCIELINYISSGQCITKNKLLSLYLPTMEFTYHKILPLPGCRVCGIDNAFHGHQVHFDTGALLTL